MEGIFIFNAGAVPMNWIDGTGPIVFAQVRCTGNESNLSDCPHNGLGLGVYNCSHSQGAGVICAGMVHLKSLVSHPCSGAYLHGTLILLTRDTLYL